MKPLCKVCKVDVRLHQLILKLAISNNLNNSLFNAQALISFQTKVSLFDFFLRFILSALSSYWFLFRLPRSTCIIEHRETILIQNLSYDVHKAFEVGVLHRLIDDTNTYVISN